MGESKIYKIRWDVRWVFRKCKVAVARREAGGRDQESRSLARGLVLKIVPMGF